MQKNISTILKRVGINPNEKNFSEKILDSIDEFLAEYSNKKNR